MEKGLYVELGAYNYHVFIDFHEVRDNSGSNMLRLQII